MTNLRTVPGLHPHLHRMQRLSTKFLGEVEYTPDSVFSFPNGIPGFEEHRDYLFLNIPENAPMMFLQSITCRNLCFVLLPVLSVAPGYRLNLSEEELHELGLPGNRQPALGRDILCATIVSIGNKELPYVNLMAPIVVNLRTRVGAQVIHPETGYSHRHPITAEELALAC